MSRITPGPWAGNELSESEVRGPIYPGGREFNNKGLTRVAAGLRVKLKSPVMEHFHGLGTEGVVV